MSLKRDNNKITVGGALNSSDLLSILPLLIEPVSGRLLVVVSNCPDIPVPANKESYIDDNRVNAGSAISDDVNKNIMPLSVCSDGGLSLDMLIE